MTFFKFIRRGTCPYSPRRRIRRVLCACAAGVFAAVMLSFCTHGSGESDAESKLNPASKSKSVFFGLIEKKALDINGTSCRENTAKIIFSENIKKYGNLYNLDLSGEGSAEGLYKYIEDLSKVHLSEIYLLSDAAVSQDIDLSEAEEESIDAVAEEYIDGLSEDELKWMGVSLKDVRGLCQRYLLASKMYESLKDGVNREVSDDEARTMLAGRICLTDQSTAEAVLARLSGGEDFSALAVRYSDSDTYEVALHRGMYSDEITEQLFALTDGEYSDVIAADDGYCIFYCISSIDSELTDKYKDEIVEDRIWEAAAKCFPLDETQIKCFNKVWEKMPPDDELIYSDVLILDLCDAAFDVTRDIQ